MTQNGWRVSYNKRQLKVRVSYETRLKVRELQHTADGECVTGNSC